MGKKTTLELLKIQQSLLRRSSSLITPLEFSRLFKLSSRKSVTLLNFAVENEIMSRLKRGLYFLNANAPATFEIANSLYSPSYISLETALSYYRVIPEVVYDITSITTKITTSFSRLNRSFTYSKINPRLFFGYKNVMIGNKKVLIAEKEKAVLDYFYFVAVGRKKINERIDMSGMDRTNLENHLPYFLKEIKGKKLVTFNKIVKRYL